MRTLIVSSSQIYGFCSPSDAAQLQLQMSGCVDEVASWLRSNRLLLNTAKTEVLWCSTSQRQHQIPYALIQIGEDYVTAAASIRDLSIHVDSDISMRSHVSRTVLTCFDALCQINSIRRCLSQQALISLIVSLVHSLLDYGCATLAGLPAQTIGRLQSVLNAAARLVFSSQKHDHVTLLLKQLHWLHSILRWSNGLNTGSLYLSTAASMVWRHRILPKNCNLSPPVTHGDVCALQPPTPSSFHRPVYPLSVIELFLSPQPGRGTVCRLLSHHHGARHVQAKTQD